MNFIRASFVIMACISFNQAKAQTIESFEGTVFPDNDWQITDEGVSWSHYIYGGSETKVDGDKCVEVSKYGSFDNSRLISPKYAIDGTSSLVFSAKVSSTYYCALVIQYSADASTWTDLETLSFTNGSIFEEKSIDLSSIPGNYFIAIKASSTYYSTSSIYLDKVVGPDVYVNPNAEMHLSENDYDFGTVAKDASATYNLVIENKGSSELTFTSATVAAPFSCPIPTSIAALSSGIVTISYSPTTVGFFNEDLTIVSNGGSDQVVTLSGMATDGSEYSEGLEGVFLPEGWSTEKETWSQNTSGTYVQEGSKSAKFTTSGIYSDARIITPKLELAGTSFLTFYARYSSNINTIQLQYSTDKLSWTNVGDLITLTDEFKENIIDLSAVGSGVYYLSFTCNTTSTSSWATNSVYIDNLMLPKKYVNPNAEIEIIESSYDFGMVAKDGSVTYDLTIANKGNSELTFSAPTVSIPFTCPTPATIAALSTATVSITYNPTTVGVFSENLTIISNGGDNQIISLSGASTDGTEFYEDFESSTVRPLRWETSSDNWFYDNTGGYGGSNAALFSKYTNVTNERLITPQLVIDNSSFVNFYASGNNGQTLQIAYSSDNSTWNTIGDAITLTPSISPYLVDLSSLAGNYYLAFTFNHGSTVSHSIYVDNITLPKIYVPTTPVIALSVDNIAFGEYYLNGTKNYTLNIANYGGNDLEISSISGAASFSSTYTGTIASGANQDVEISFTPTTADSFSETLTVNSNASSGANTLSLTGEGFAAESMLYNESFEVTPAHWEFTNWYSTTSQVIDGAKSYYSSSANATIVSTWVDLTGTNPEINFNWHCASNKMLTVEISTNAIDFVEIYNGATTTSDWESKTLDLIAYANETVKFRFTTDPTLSYSDPTYLDNLTIRNKPTAPIFSVSPDAFDFGTVILSEESDVETFTVSNIGVGTLVLNAISLTGTNASEFELTTIATPINLMSNSQDIQIKYKPSTSGAHVASLSITDQDATVHTIALSGTSVDVEIKTLPYTEDFDALLAPELPMGWKTIVSSTSGSALIANASYSGNASSNAVRMYGGGADGILMLIMPFSQLELPITEVSFDAKGASNMEMGFGYMTDPSDESTYIEIQNFEVPSGMDSYTVNMGEINSSGTYYLAFKLNTPTTYSSIYIDDIEWKADEKSPAATIIPIDGAVDVNPYTTIKLMLDETIYKNGGGELLDADLPSILTLKETDAAGSDVIFSASIAGNEITLEPNTKMPYSSVYYVALSENSVQDIAGNLNALTVSSFTTQAAPFLASAPFQESFEAATFVPTNWTETRTKWERYAANDITYISGAAAAKYTSSSGWPGNADSAEMITPVIDISTLSDPNFTFFVKKSEVEFSILASYDMGLSFTSIYDKNEELIDWTEGAIKLDKTKDNVMLKFYAENPSYTNSSIYLDSIFVAEAPVDPIYTASHAEYDFGTVILTDSAEFQMLVTNTGGQSISIASVSITGVNAADFSIATLTLPAVLEANELSIDITFKPATIGAKTASLVVEETGGIQHTIPLTAKAFDSEIKTLTYLEDFDVVPADEIPIGWSTIINTTATEASVKVANNLQANSAPNELLFNGGQEEGTIMAILPYTNLDLTDARLKLTGRGSTGCTLIAGYIADKDDESTFVEIDTFEIETYNQLPFEADLSSISVSGSYHLALKLGSPSSIFKIYIDDVKITNNQAPIIITTPTVDIHTGVEYNYTLETTDNESDARTITAKYKPDWLTLTDNGDGTATLIGTPSTKGSNDVTLVVKDVENEVKQDFDIMVTNETPIVSSSPVLNTLTNEVYTYEIVVSDADADNLVIIAETKPSWLTFVDNGDGTATLTGTPTVIGSYSVAIKATDGFDDKFQYFDIEVADPNNIPEFTSTQVESVIVGEVYVYNITAHDLDDDAITISTSLKPEWLTLTDNGDGTALLTGSTTTVSVYYVTLVLSDGKDTREQDIRIAVSEVPNAEPSITSTPIVEAKEGQLYTYELLAEDVDVDDVIGYSALQKPTWLTLIDNGDKTATLSGTPTTYGTFDISINVFDGTVTANQTFQLIVAANLLPEFTSTPMLSVFTEELYSYTAMVTDAESSPLTFIDDSIPSWLTMVDNNEGIAEFSGVAAEVGNYNVVILVSDGVDTARQVFELFVENKPNTAPEFVSVEHTKVMGGEKYSYHILTTDQEGDVLSIVALDKPEWLTLVDSANGKASLSGIAPEHGRFNVQLKVSDSEYETLQNFSILVTEIPNSEPVFTSTPLTKAKEAQPYSYTILAEDVDVSDVLTYAANKKPEWLTLMDNGDGSAILSGTPTESGAFDIVIAVTDGGVTVTQAFQLEVTPKPNESPVFTSSPVLEVISGEIYSYNIGISDKDSTNVLRWVDCIVPQWLSLSSIDGDQAILSGTAVALGDYNVVLNVTDGVDTTQQVYSIEVKGISQNAPAFTSSPLLNAKVDQEYLYVYSAEDVDNDSVIFGFVELPNWLNFSKGAYNGLLSGIPSVSGDYKVSVYATDTKDTVYQTFEIKVEQKDNSLPAFVSIPNDSVEISETYLYRLLGSDLDGDSLVFIAGDIPKWLDLVNATDSTASLYGKTTITGRYPVSILLSDGRDTVSQSFDVVVYSNNSSPLFLSVPNSNGFIDSLYNYQVIVDDIDGDSLMVSSLNTPDWLQFEYNGNGLAQLSGIPVEEGEFMVELMATDKQDTVYQKFTIVIQVVHVEDVHGFQMKIYPNPVCTMLSVTGYELVYCDVYNQLGALVLSKDCENDQCVIDVSTLPQGIYILKVTNRYGKENVQRFSKQ